MTAEDTTSRTEAAARDTAQLLGASEHIGGGMGDQGVTTPYCDHCQAGTKGYVCGPCTRDEGLG